MISARHARRDQPGAWGVGSAANSRNTRGRDKGTVTTVDPSVMNVSRAAPGTKVNLKKGIDFAKKMSLWPGSLTT